MVTASQPDLLKVHWLVFEINIAQGHNAFYVQILADYWCKQRPSGSLTFVVLPTLYEALGDFVACAADSGIHFLCLTPEELSTRHTLATDQPALSFAKLISSEDSTHFALYYEWELLQRYAAQTGATHAFIPRLDSYLPLIATGIQSSIPISGILLAADFYRTGETSAELKTVHLRQKFTLARALKQSYLETIFFLDHVAAQIAQPQFGNRIRYLADPIQLIKPSPTAIEQLRHEYKIAQGKTIALLFGDLTERKGLQPLLAALGQLDNSLGEQLCLLLVGTINTALLQKAHPTLEHLRKQKHLHIVVHNEYVPQTEVPAYFALADVVLLPYLEHRGMSGVLLWAAAAGRPVIATDVGLIGELVREYQLGLLMQWVGGG